MMWKGVVCIFGVYILSSQTVQTQEVPQYNIANKLLEMTVSSSVTWGLESLFTIQNLRYWEIAHFSLIGDSPCSLEGPRLSLTEMFVINGKSYVEDFAVVGQQLFFMTRDYIKGLQYDDPLAVTAGLQYEIHNVTGKGYTYFDVFKLANSSLIFFFKGAESSFTYARFNSQNYKLETQKITPSHFGNFKDPMKITAYDNLVFIPAGTKGLYVYEYVPGVETLEPVSLVLNDTLMGLTPDVREVAVLKDYTAEDSLMLVIADYMRGVLFARYSLKEKITTTLDVLMVGLKAKSVTCKKQGLYYKVTALGDVDSNVSKFIVMSLYFNGMKEEHTQDVIKVLDGLAQAHDADGMFASILMPNSLLTTRLGAQSINEFKYINSPGICHAKLYQSADTASSLMFYTQDTNIVSVRVDLRYGSLVCHSPSSAQDYFFRVVGRSKRCPKPLNQSKDLDACEYVADVSLQVTDQSYVDAWADLLITLYVIFGILVMLLLSLIVVLILCIVWYRRTQRKLQYYEQIDKADLNSGGNGNQKAPKTTDPAPPPSLELKEQVKETVKQPANQV